VTMAPAQYQVHPLSSTGFGTGTNDLYDRVRPSYPDEALAHIRKAIRTETDLNVLEIGSGTGKFTRALLSHPDWKSSIAHIKAIDPSEGMRSVFLREVKDPRVQLSEGTFDRTGVEDGWADLIVIAHAFHWCLDFDAAAEEFARVLKPGGAVALAWNYDDPSKATWVEQYEQLSESYEKRLDSHQETRKWRRFFGTDSFDKNFNKPEETTYFYNLVASEQIVVGRLLSRSYFVVLSDEEREEARGAAMSIIQKGDGKVWVDKEQGLFESPYLTQLYIFIRK